MKDIRRSVFYKRSSDSGMGGGSKAYRESKGEDTTKVDAKIEETRSNLLAYKESTKSGIREISKEELIQSVDVNAKWNGIEKKVTYSASFINANTGKRESLYGYISKSGLYEDMKSQGASEDQIKAAKSIAKKIKASAYKR